jgi:hypothetical protein
MVAKGAFSLPRPSPSEPARESTHMTLPQYAGTSASATPTENNKDFMVLLLLLFYEIT